MGDNQSDELDEILSKLDISDEDLQHLVDAIDSGADSFAEAVGFDEAGLRAIENIALTYYRSKIYRDAVLVYAFLIRIQPTYSSAWRGLGACLHAQRCFPWAMLTYRIALDLAPDDVISRVFLGEVLCHLGETEQGLDELRQAIQDAGDKPYLERYVQRAHAIVAAKGGIPSETVLKHRAKTLAAQATTQLDEQSQDNAAPSLSETSRPITVDDMHRNPELAAELKELTKAVQNGELTFGQIGGFSEKELEGAYVCACKYVERDDPLRALQILGWLMFLSPYDGRYYQLVGIIMQRTKSYAAARQYYEMALQFAPEDPLTWAYSGECALMIGSKGRGIEELKRCLEVAGSDAKHDRARKRAKALLQQFP